MLMNDMMVLKNIDYAICSLKYGLVYTPGIFPFECLLVLDRQCRTFHVMTEETCPKPQTLIGVRPGY